MKKFKELRERLEEACWKGYKAIGTKIKNGKEVANCVPVKEDVDLNKITPSAETIAKKHKVDLDKIKKELEMGIEVEKEHATDEKTAQEIALDHLNEIPNYYTKLKKYVESVDLEEDWQKVNRSDRTDGLSQKAVDAYRRENPGSKLQTAVTEKNPKGKRASRRKSFCARMSGMKRAHASDETKRDPDSPINKALRRWRC